MHIAGDSGRAVIHYWPDDSDFTMRYWTRNDIEKIDLSYEGHNYGIFCLSVSDSSIHIHGTSKDGDAISIKGVHY